MASVLEPSRPTRGAAAAVDPMRELLQELSTSSRMTVRLRPDGLIEVATTEGVVGFVEYVAPVYVSLAGPWPAAAIEIAQHRTLPEAVEELRRAIANG